MLGRRAPFRNVRNYKTMPEVRVAGLPPIDLLASQRCKVFDAFRALKTTSSDESHPSALRTEAQVTLNDGSAEEM